MLFRKINKQHFKPATLSFVVFLLAGVICAPIESFRDHLTVQSPSSIFLAENALNPQYTECRTLNAEEDAKAYSLQDIYATCVSAQATLYAYVFSTCRISTSKNLLFKGFFPFSTDLSPPTV
jgi:hypothetical protein